MPARLTRTRQVALEVLQRVRAGDLVDRALDRLGAELTPRDFGWTQELVYGAFRLRGRIDHRLEGLVRRGTESLEPDVLDALRLGAYQLMEMGSVPPYAAVSQTVELVRWAKAGRAAGLVNGVLQSLLRRGTGSPYPDPEVDPVGFLCTWGSHPSWLVERWLARWGFEETRALVEANNRRPELYLRPLGEPVPSVIARLASAGIAGEAVTYSPDSVRILPPATAREALAVVPAVVQDPAAALVVRFASVQPGMAAIDLCAAPGGKALGMAAAARRVVAADLSLTRVRRLRENVARAGLTERVAVVVADARQPPFAPADLVLLDAPCTGTGTLRRHPDGRWRVTEHELSALADLQRELLEAAAPLVRPSGFLVYSTCSLEPEENEVQMREFLVRHPEYVPMPEPDAVDPSLLDRDRSLVVLPQRQGVDGSFAARLRRVA